MNEYQQNDKQSYIYGNNNIWMLKPSDLSRGRGIRCYNSIQKIIDIVANSSNQYVIQKYIERPLLVSNRKVVYCLYGQFDIRQWVLIRNFNPLQVWVYEEYYLRFSSLEFSLSNLENRYIHLTNNAIQHDQNDNDEFYQNMWTRQ